jgi:hypothetical protein
MSQRNSEFWKRARRARDKLVDQFLDHPHPDVSLIDIGYDPDQGAGGNAEHIVLRVHVRRPLTREEVGLPAQVDGIPVRVLLVTSRHEPRMKRLPRQ